MSIAGHVSRAVLSRSRVRTDAKRHGGAAGIAMGGPFTSSTGWSSRSVTGAHVGFAPTLAKTPAFASLEKVLFGLATVPRVFGLRHHRRLGFDFQAVASVGDPPQGRQ
jgi:hypothetical protein